MAMIDEDVLDQPAETKVDYSGLKKKSTGTVDYSGLKKKRTFELQPTPLEEGKAGPYLPEAKILETPKGKQIEFPTQYAVEQRPPQVVAGPIEGRPNERAVIPGAIKAPQAPVEISPDFQQKLAEALSHSKDLQRDVPLLEEKHKAVDRTSPESVNAYNKEYLANKAKAERLDSIVKDPDFKKQYDAYIAGNTKITPEESRLMQAQTLPQAASIEEGYTGPQKGFYAGKPQPIAIGEQAQDIRRQQGELPQKLVGDQEKFIKPFEYISDRLKAHPAIKKIAEYLDIPTETIVGGIAGATKTYAEATQEKSPLVAAAKALEAEIQAPLSAIIGTTGTGLAFVTGQKVLQDTAPDVAGAVNKMLTPITSGVRPTTPEGKALASVADVGFQALAFSLLHKMGIVEDPIRNIREEMVPKLFNEIDKNYDAETLRQTFQRVEDGTASAEEKNLVKAMRYAFASPEYARERGVTFTKRVYKESVPKWIQAILGEYPGVEARIGYKAKAEEARPPLLKSGEQPSEVVPSEETLSTLKAKYPTVAQSIEEKMKRGEQFTPQERNVIRSVAKAPPAVVTPPVKEEVPATEQPIHNKAIAEGWSEEHDPLSQMAAMPNEPIYIHKNGDALSPTEDGKYYIQRPDGTYLLNPDTKNSLFDSVEEAQAEHAKTLKTEKPPVAEPETKQPWEMTRGKVQTRRAEKIFPLEGKVEVVNGKPVYTYTTTLKWDNDEKTFEIKTKNPLNGADQAARLHQKMVEQAVAEGKPVPPEVLKDYPDLERKPDYTELKKKESTTVPPKIGVYTLIPSEKAQPKETILGKNQKGETVGIDKNGIRFKLVQNGKIRVTAPVGIMPTREGLKYGSQEVSDDFKTVGELESAQKHEEGTAFEKIDIDKIPKNLEIEVEAIREATGEKIQIRRNARQALQDVDSQLEKYKKLIPCLKS